MRYECLRCKGPGTGMKGAPRAFSLKLRKVTSGPICKMISTTMDREFEVRHDDGAFTACGAKHVDDIKYAGRPDILLKSVLPELEKVFGKLTYNEGDFTLVSTVSVPPMEL